VQETPQERVKQPLPELHAFPDSLVFARKLGSALGWPVERIALHHFPDWESLVRVRATPGAPAIVVRSLNDPNAKLVELLLAADALRRASAGPLTLVCPYLAYMRQDRLFTPGEPISQRVVGTLLGGAFDRVLCVEAHLHRVKTLGEVFPCPAESLPAAPALTDWLRTHAVGALLVGPDEESEPWVRALAERAGLAFRIGVKRRRGDAEVELRLPALPAGVARAVLVDDIASTGATLAAGARALQAAGAPRVDALVVHAIFAEGALPALRAAGIARIASTDTIPHPTNEVGVAPLLAAALAGESA
jgi:ribose-phosphate pyrophosphokinase